MKFKRGKIFREKGNRFIAKLFSSTEGENDISREKSQIYDGSIEDWTEYFKDKKLVLKAQFEPENHNGYTRCMDVVFGHSPEAYFMHKRMGGDQAKSSIAMGLLRTQQRRKTLNIQLNHV